MWAFARNVSKQLDMIGSLSLPNHLIACEWAACSEYTLNLTRTMLSRQIFRWSRQLFLEGSQPFALSYYNHGCTRKFLVAARCFASDPRRRGPLMVADETPVDTSKYSNVLIKLKSYDSAVVTSYFHFVDQAARNMNFNVTKKFNLKTEEISVTLANPPHFFREKNMQYHFKGHGRMLQVESIPSEMADIFIQYIQKNVPAGVSVDIELKKWEDFVSPPNERSTTAETGWSGFKG